MTTKMLGEERIGLMEMVDELLMVLNEKERDVIMRRYSLNNSPRETLELIGKRFNVTRERIRQIEASALKKLQRNVHNSSLKRLSQSIEERLEERGGIMLEQDLVSALIEQMEREEIFITGEIVRLVLSITPKVGRSDATKIFHRFWYLEEMLTMREIKRIADTSHKILAQHKDVRDIDDHIAHLLEEVALMEEARHILESIIQVDSRIRILKERKIGLQEWRHVNPKSIHDKALLVLREKGKPMHFIEIANGIIEAQFDEKRITVQAVHNDLIRYSDFVLVGRGIYALAEWGYKTGTVADVIMEFLKEKGEATKKEIIQHVQSVRDVKVGTISLNLQKEDAFYRVGRAVYAFDPERWQPKKDGRGRKKKA